MITRKPDGQWLEPTLETPGEWLTRICPRCGVEHPVDSDAVSEWDDDADVCGACADEAYQP